jgi:hypothetical protein
MQIDNKEITLFSLLCCILLIIIITTIVSYYNYSIHNQFSTLYIQAQPESNNKDSDNNKKEELDDKDDTKEKDKKKKDDDDKESWAKADQDLITKYNYRNLVIPKVYQSAPGGEKYYFKHDNPNGKVQVDEEKNENVFTKQNRDGSWRIDYGRPRIDIYTKDAGILLDKQILQENLSKSSIQSWNFSELKDIGYWYKPTDWKNIEVTLIFKLLDSSRSKGEQHALSLVTRSISHSENYDDDDDNDEPPFYCGGSSYHNNISNEGYLRMKKEQYHVDYVWERYADTLTIGNIYDKIIGIKGIVYNINDTAVKLESWVDLENGGKGSYKKVHEFIDNSNWGDAMTECGATIDGQAITWGSPLVIIKANDFKFDIYDIEVREIILPNGDK